jgi:hypothetical protein
VLGPGTIGLLVAMFARAAGAEVHLTGRPGQSTEFVRGLGFASCWTEDTLPDLPFDALIDASDAEHLRALALAARSILGRSWPPPSGLEQVGSVLAGQRPPGAGRGPKIHVDPRIV